MKTFGCCEKCLYETRSDICVLSDFVKWVIDLRCISGALIKIEDFLGCLN
jgi:hypothetical protein